MNRLSRMAILLGIVAFAFTGAASAELKVGDAAPDFTLAGSNGEKNTLSSFAGEKNVVLAFFPKAFTGG